MSQQPYQMPNQRAANYQYLVAIDPDIGEIDAKTGRKKGGSGMAIWSYSEGKFIHHHYHRIMDLLKTIKPLPASQTIVYVEAGWLNEGMHQRRKEALPDDFQKWNPEAKQAYMFKLGTDTGRNQGTGELIIDLLEEMGFVVKPYQPTGKKWKPVDVKQFTGITATMNQDVRDALRIAFVNK